MRRRLWIAASVALLAACSDGELATGPDAPPPATNITTVGGLAFGYSDICGTVTDPSGGLPGVQAVSPCDGDSNIAAVGSGPDPDKLPYTGSTYWLSSLEQNPSPVPANFSGLAGRLHVRAYPYPNQAYCANLEGGSNGVCGLRNLEPVTEVTDATTGASLRYASSWKTKKSRAGGPGAGDLVPDNSYWQIVTFLDFDGDGQYSDSEDIASRIIKWTSTPSTDQPSDGWSLDINWGSNQNIPFVLEANSSGCFGTASAAVQVQCLVDFDNGGVLTLVTDNGSIILTLGAGNTGLPLSTVTGSECTTGDLDVDAPTAGTCSEWTVNPPLPASTILTNSFLCVAETGLPTDISNYVINMSDADGVLALTPDPSGCPTGFAQAGDPGTGFAYVWNRVKNLLAPRQLIAGHGSSGSRISTIRSEFQLVKTAQMQAVGGVSSVTVAENSRTTLSAVVKDHENSPTYTPGLVSGAEIAVFAKAGTGGSVACPASPASTGSCVAYSGTPPSWAGSAVVVTTGSDGLVEVVATTGTVSTEIRMLGCAIAVPGSDTPAGSDIADSPGPCNRDPGEEDLAATPANGGYGFANGPEVGIVDPFMSGGVANPVWANDLPLIYTLDVCSAPTVDGVKDGNDPWASDSAGNGCVPLTSVASFDVNVGGNIGGGTTGPATAQWFAAGDRVFIAAEIPLNSDPFSKKNSKVEVAVTFDAGNGSGPGAADENDDQIVLSRDGSSLVLTGDVSDRYLKASCTNGSSACNSDDSDLGGGNDAQGAMAWDPSSNTLFIELSQVVRGGDLTVDPNLPAGSSIGFILQLGVGNVRQGGTDYPDQGSGVSFQTVQIP